MICHYWFFNHGFKFEDSVFDGCHNLTMISVNISDITIITVKNVDYRFMLFITLANLKQLTCLKTLCL